jgi:CRP/FNR family transcriptional regulator, dissimilatory nitrate respiration regulator
VLDANDLATARETILFASLPKDLADTILQRVSTRSYRRGETVFLQGDPAENIYVVLEGWVKLFRTTPSGSEAVVGVFTRGRSFGEAVAFAGGAFPVSSETVTDVRLVQVRASILVTMMRERPEIATAVLAAAFKHLHGLVAQLEQIKAQSGAQRVAEFLLELCSLTDGSCTITLPYDKNLIAGRLGMQPPSLSRAFHRLDPVGVKISHNQATIRDIGKLREFVLQDRSSSWRKAE